MEIQSDIAIEFWLNNGTLNEVLGLTIKNCLLYFSINQTDTLFYNQIGSFNFGEISVDYSALVGEKDLPLNHTNFDMNMVKIHEYLDSIKPVITFGLNKYLEKQPW